MCEYEAKKPRWIVTLTVYMTKLLRGTTDSKALILIITVVYSVCRLIVSLCIVSHYMRIDERDNTERDNKATNTMHCNYNAD